MYDQNIAATFAPRKRISLNVDAILAGTFHWTALEVGREWLALLHGEPSRLERFAKVKMLAGRRPNGGTWGRTRQRIFERDGYACTYCGAAGPLECDHVIPVAQGGGHHDANLTTACRPCNLAKSDKTPEEWRGQHG